MDSKRLKYLQLFGDLSRVAITDNVNFKDKLELIIDLDFSYGVEIWEYMSLTYENIIIKNKDLANFLGTDCLNLFYENNMQKTLRAIKDIDSISRVVFLYSPSADKEMAQVIVAEWLMGGKYDSVDVVFKLLQKNINIDFNEYIKVMVSYAISETIDKCTSDNTKIIMPKKLKEVLLKHINRLKGQDKVLLIQRIKEVS